MNPGLVYLPRKAEFAKSLMLPEFPYGVTGAPCYMHNDLALV